MDKYQIDKIIKKAEAEARITKPPIGLGKSLSSKRSAFLNKGRSGGGGGGGVIDCSLFRGGSGCWISTDPVNSGVTTQLMDQATKINTILNAGIQTPVSGGVGANFLGTSAKYGNKGYELLIGPSGYYIVEFIIDIPNSTASLGQIYSLTGGIPSNQSAIGSAMCSKDASTMLLGEYEVAEAQLQTNGTWTYNTLFTLPLGYSTTGDIIYRPSDNTIVIAVHNHPTYEIHHYEYNGTLIDSITISNVGLVTMFCSGGKLYAPATGFSSTAMVLYEIETNPLAIVVATPNYPTSYPQDGDGGTSPECCGVGVTSTGVGVTSTDCYNIGDTGPEGGTIFAVPLSHPQNTGLNQSDYYYEVGKNDIAIGNTTQGCFNDSCGEEVVTSINGNSAVPHAGVDINQMFFFWNPITAYPGVGSDPPPQVGDVVTASSSNGFPIFFDNLGNPLQSTTIAAIPYGVAVPPGQGPIAIIIADDLNPLMDPAFNNAYSLPFTYTITTVTASPCASPAMGSEWGAHDQQNIGTSNAFGFGQKNTDIIDAYPQPPNGGVHPVLDTHDIAATLCKQQPGSSVATQYHTGFNDDWFLPSYEEFFWMNYNLGDPNTSSYPLSSYAANQLMLNTVPGQLSEQYYWTSSKEIPVNTPIPNEEKYAWAFNASTGFPELVYRCHTLSVRPIRRFKCKVPPPAPCPTPDCNFEYNYRDGLTSIDGGTMNSSADLNVSGSLPTGAIHWNTTNEGCLPGVPPQYPTADSSLGGDHMTMYLNRWNVLGEYHSNADFLAGFNSGNIGYTVTAWDTKYNFMGKWRYSNLTQLIGGGNTRTSRDRPGTNNFVILKVNGVQHLAGDYPVIHYTGKPDVSGSTGSYTGAFFKIEWDGNTGNYETGCNSTVFGNPHPYYSPLNGEDYPYYCGPYYFSGVYQGNISLPRYATAPPLDISGNVLPVYPTIYDSNPYITPSSQVFGGSNGYYDMQSAPSCDTPPAAIQNHCFSICATRDIGGSWDPVGNSWFGGEPYGPIAMENNPSGPTVPPFSSNPPVDLDYQSFFFWALLAGSATQNPGDTFIYDQPGYTMQFTVTDPTTGISHFLASVSAICFKYRGVQTYTVPLNMINDGYGLPQITGNGPGNSCCVSSGPSSLTIPVENNPDSIKLSVNARTPTKREGFIAEKRQDKNTGPFGVFGYFPLYDNIKDAIKNSSVNSYHIHEFEEQEYYMPDGLEIGKTQFHGDWKPTAKTINVESVDLDTDTTFFTEETDLPDIKSSKKDYR